MWHDVAERIRKADKVVITTHINPESDAIGSAVALAAFLEDLGKHPTVVLSSPMPQNSAFMDPDNKTQVYPDEWDATVLDDADLVVIVDVNNWGHVGPFAKALRQSTVPRICIDHHEGADNGFADVVVRVPRLRSG